MRMSVRRRLFTKGIERGNGTVYAARGDVEIGDICEKQPT